MRKLRQRHKFRLFLLRWHRRVGVGIALLVILLVVTGIPLNHTSGWQLDRRAVRAPWLLAHYGIQVADPIGYPVGERWIIRAGRHLFLDGVEVGRCASDLVGAVATDQMLVAVCAEELVLLTDDGELIERVGSTYGIPLPMTGVTLAENKLWLQSKARWYQLDLDSLSWTAAGAGSSGSLRAAGPSTIPPALRGAVSEAMLGESLTVERVLLDLHSGRLFGAAGVWLMDMAGVMLLIIAVSGCYVWLSKPGRFRRR